MKKKISRKRSTHSSPSSAAEASSSSAAAAAAAAAAARRMNSSVCLQKSKGSEAALIDECWKVARDNDGQFTDLTFVLQCGETVSAHQLVLQKVSPRLAQLFAEQHKSHWSRCHCNDHVTVFIPSLKRSRLLPVLQLIYTGQCTLSESSEIWEDTLQLLGVQLNTTARQPNKNTANAIKAKRYKSKPSDVTEAKEKTSIAVNKGHGNDRFKSSKDVQKGKLPKEVGNRVGRKSKNEKVKDTNEKHRYEDKKQQNKVRSAKHHDKNELASPPNDNKKQLARAASRRPQPPPSGRPRRPSSGPDCGAAAAAHLPRSLKSLQPYLTSPSATARRRRRSATTTTSDESDSGNEIHTGKKVMKKKTFNGVKMSEKKRKHSLDKRKVSKEDNSKDSVSVEQKQSRKRSMDSEEEDSEVSVSREDSEEHNSEVSGEEIPSADLGRSARKKVTLPRVPDSGGRKRES